MSEHLNRTQDRRRFRMPMQNNTFLMIGIFHRHTLFNIHPKNNIERKTSVLVIFSLFALITSYVGTFKCICPPHTPGVHY